MAYSIKDWFVTSAEECKCFVKQYPTNQLLREVTFCTIKDGQEELEGSEFVPYSNFFTNKIKKELGYNVVVGSGYK